MSTCGVGRARGCARDIKCGTRHLDGSSVSCNHEGTCWVLCARRLLSDNTLLCLPANRRALVRCGLLPPGFSRGDDITSGNVFAANTMVGQVCASPPPSPPMPPSPSPPSPMPPSPPSPYNSLKTLQTATLPADWTSAAINWNGADPCTPTPWTGVTCSAGLPSALSLPNKRLRLLVSREG